MAYCELVAGTSLEAPQTPVVFSRGFFDGEIRTVSIKLRRNRSSKVGERKAAPCVRKRPAWDCLFINIRRHLTRLTRPSLGFEGPLEVKWADVGCRQMGCVVTLNREEDPIEECYSSCRNRFESAGPGSKEPARFKGASQIWVRGRRYYCTELRRRNWL
jgi:hypothetical protein